MAHPKSHPPSDTSREALQLGQCSFCIPYPRVGPVSGRKAAGLYLDTLAGPEVWGCWDKELSVSSFQCSVFTPGHVDDSNNEGIFKAGWDS